MEKRFVMASSLLVALVLVLAACAPKSASSPAPATQVPAPTSPIAAAPLPAKPVAPAITKPAWEVEWGKTLETAKREGRVSLVLGAVGPSVRASLAEGFKKAHGIAVETISAKGSEISTKVVAEHRAGIYSYDLAMIGSNTHIPILKPIGALDPLEPLLVLPEVTNPELIKKIWWGGKLWWVDGDRMVLISALRLSYPLAINTNLVKDGEVKSYRDLLSSKWRGKIALNDPTAGGSGANFLLFIDTTLGHDYLAELIKAAEPVVIRNERLPLEWLSHGKVAVVGLPNAQTLIELQKAGAPIKGLIPAEGTWLGDSSGSQSLFKKAPHPNAAKIFINWLLTKEGQSALIVPMGSQSLRSDVAVDHLPPDQRRVEGMKYFLADEKAMLSQTAEALQKQAGELLRPLMAK